MQVSCRALCWGGDTPSTPGVTDPLPSLRQPAWPHNSASRIWPHAHVLGMVFLSPMVMLYCQLGVSRNYPYKPGGWGSLVPYSMVL